MNYKLLILLFAVSQAWGADAQPPVLGSVIEECMEIARALPAQKVWPTLLGSLEEGFIWHRLEIPEVDRRVYVPQTIFAVAAAMSNQGRSWFARNFSSPAWRIETYSGLEAVSQGPPIDIPIAGFQLLIEPSKAFDPETLRPLLARAIDELRQGWRQESVHPGTTVSLVKHPDDTFGKKYLRRDRARYADEGDIIRTILAEHNLLAKKIKTVGSSSRSGTYHPIRIDVAAHDLPAVCSILGLKFKERK